MKATLLTVASLVAFGLLLWQVVLSQAPYECEACTTYEGRRACGRVAASSAGEARARALSQACSILASGVTDSLACERRPPDSMECSEP